MPDAVVLEPAHSDDGVGSHGGGEGAARAARVDRVGERAAEDVHVHEVGRLGVVLDLRRPHHSHAPAQVQALAEVGAALVVVHRAGVHLPECFVLLHLLHDRAAVRLVHDGEAVGVDRAQVNLRGVKLRLADVVQHALPSAHQPGVAREQPLRHRLVGDVGHAGAEESVVQVQVQRILRRGADNVGEQQLRVARVQRRVLDRAPEEVLRVLHEVLVQSSVEGDIDGKAVLPAAAGAPRLLPQGGDAAGKAEVERGAQLPHVHPQLHRVRGAHRAQPPVVQPPLDVTALLRAVP
mmetsp:Transcript_6397/g.16554  ORF Transcript_6397/g.16554 Transcript_6397/m.16554 type:complete len:293 (-) Transcript_6397:1913-2791(-)